MCTSSISLVLYSNIVRRFQIKYVVIKPNIFLAGKFVNLDLATLLVRLQLVKATKAR